MKAVMGIVSAVVLAIGFVACEKVSPASPSASAAQPIEQAQLFSIIWGTHPTENGVEYYVGVEPGSVAAGNSVTGHLHQSTDYDANHTYNLTYGPRAGGPATVTVPAGSIDVTFTVTTSTGSLTDATVIANGVSTHSTLGGSKQGSNIVWGT